SGVDVTAEARDISLIGRMIESNYLYADERRNRQNFELVETPCNDLQSSLGLRVESPHRGAVLWHNVPVDRIATFIDDFVVHPLSHNYQGDAIAEFSARPAVSRRRGFSQPMDCRPDDDGRGRSNPVRAAAGLGHRVDKSPSLPRPSAGLDRDLRQRFAGRQPKR